MALPETRNVKSGEVRIAYQVVGQGLLDLVFAQPGLSNLEVHWEEPGFSHLLHRLASFTRLILLDRRGCGGFAHFHSSVMGPEALADFARQIDGWRAVA
jgi:pimeloyl-ACP methyl ester carboxylesterase